MSNTQKAKLHERDYMFFGCGVKFYNGWNNQNITYIILTYL